MCKRFPIALRCPNDDTIFIKKKAGQRVCPDFSAWRRRRKHFAPDCRGESSDNEPRNNTAAQRNCGERQRDLDPALQIKVKNVYDRQCPKAD